MASKVRLYVVGRLLGSVLPHLSWPPLSNLQHFNLTDFISDPPFSPLVLVALLAPCCFLSL